jgi:hypothetical protein
LGRGRHGKGGGSAVAAAGELGLELGVLALQGGEVGLLVGE